MTGQASKVSLDAEPEALCPSDTGQNLKQCALWQVSLGLTTVPAVTLTESTVPCFDLSSVLCLCVWGVKFGALGLRFSVQSPQSLKSKSITFNVPLRLLRVYHHEQTQL